MNLTTCVCTHLMTKRTEVSAGTGWHGIGEGIDEW